VLLGGRASLNGLLVFISVLGGIEVFGILGVILGPIVVATAVGILDVYSGIAETERAPNVPVV
jgi:predicted PurR-regulated permease PerM